MKKIIGLFFVLLVIGLSIEGYLYYTSPKSNEDFEDIWKTSRKLPKDLALNAYLAGNVAKKDHRISQALEAYEKVLKKDPENSNLLKDFYVLAMFQGNPQIVLPYIDKLPDSMRPILLADYLKSAQLFSENPEQLLNFLNKKKKQKSDAIVLPLIRSWYAAQMNDKKAAINSLKSIQENQAGYILGYQEFLLGTYLMIKHSKKMG